MLIFKAKLDSLLLRPKCSVPTFAGPQGSFGQHNILTWKMSDSGTFRVREDHIAQIPLVGQMSMTNRDAQGEDLSDRFAGNDVVFGTVVGLGQVGAMRRLLLLWIGRRSKVQVDVVVVVFEVMVKTMRRGSASCTSTNTTPHDETLVHRKHNGTLLFCVLELHHDNYNSSVCESHTYRHYCDRNSLVLILIFISSTKDSRIILRN